jgi:hypothetical protein
MPSQREIDSRVRLPPIHCRLRPSERTLPTYTSRAAFSFWRADQSSAKQQRKGLFVANKSDLYVGSPERAGQRASNEQRASGDETKAATKFKAVVTATMKRRALKPKKTKAEAAR